MPAGIQAAPVSPRGLDHIVHAVRDLDAQADFYRRVGFTVGAHNKHSWGTHNRIVQLPGFFVELLNIGQPDLIEPHTPDSFSFGGFLRDFLAREEGLAMLVLEGKGAANDAEAFQAAGIGDFKVFDFEREAKRPDGSVVKVAFSLAFAVDAKAPDAGFFTCQQHYPENFWNPAFQQHANGVSGVAGVVFVAENPADHHVFLKAFAGVSDLTSTSSGITIETPRGEIQAMDPAAYRLHFAVEPPDSSHGMRLAAIRFAASDINLAREKIGASAAEHMGKLVVGPAAAHGATLVFEPVAR
jgi:catechol 2,3-dioxygenase-like lactoylglutathione lyase family enzyme